MNTNTKKNATTNTTTNKSRNNGRKENTMKTNTNKKANGNNWIKRNWEEAAELVANRTIEEMEKGVVFWQKPWFGTVEGAIKRSGQPYSPLNQFLLGDDGEYIGFKQIQKEGGRLKKGAKGKQVLFFKWLEYEETLEDGTKELKRFAYPKTFYVFRIEDTDLKPTERNKTGNCKPNELAEKVINGYIESSGVKFKNKKTSNKAYYRASTDTVVVPSMKQYKDVEEYYSTAFHELTHSTGHESRLNRGTGNEFFGSTNYGKEELIAELGAAILVNTCGLETEKSFKNSASYIDNWMKAIKEDPRMLISAASKASKAVEMIVGDTVLDEEPPKKTKTTKTKTTKAKTKTTKKAKTKKATVKEGHYKKTTFKIRVKDGYKEVDGYETKVGKVRIGLHKKYGWWYVTEIPTGLALGGNGHKTRDEAVEFVKKDMMNAIKKFIESEKYTKAKDELKKAKKVA